MSVSCTAKCVLCDKSYWELAKHFLMAVHNHQVQLPRYVKRYILSFLIGKCECPTCKVCLVCENCVSIADCECFQCRNGFSACIGFRMPCYDGEEHECHKCMKLFQIDYKGFKLRRPQTRQHYTGVLMCSDCINKR